MLTVPIVLMLAGGALEINRAPWYEPRQLFVMTGFIANSTSGTWGADFLTRGDWTPEKQKTALAAWNRGLGASYDADKSVEAFQRAGATGVIFYDKWHDGLVPHATGLTRFRTERDLVGETVRALHKHGMKAVIYYSVGFDYNPEPRFLEWACRDAAGRPMGRPFPTDWMSFHSPYRQYVIGHLVEIIKKYGPLEGVWLDIFSQPASLDRYSKEAFSRQFGKALEEATPEERSEFTVRTLGDFLTEIRRAVRTAQPGISVTFNGAGMADMAEPRHASLVDAQADYFSMEGHRWANIERGARVGHAMDRPFEVGMLLSSSWYVPMEDQAPPPSMGEAEAVVSAATAWIHGANVYGAMTPGHSGEYDERGDVRLLKVIGGWLRDNREWLNGAEPYADVGIVLGTARASVHRNPMGARPGMTLDPLLRKAGYTTELVGGGFAKKHFKLDQYRMLLVADGALLDVGLAEEIREYARAGGKVLALGRASLYSETGEKRADFALRDLYGVQYAGELPGYKQLAGMSSEFRLNAPAVEVKATTGRVVATWRGAANAPAVVENQYGKGRSLYFSALESGFPENDPVAGELAGRLIGAPPVRIEGRREYRLLMNRKGDSLLLYVVNRSTAGGAASGEPVRVTIDTAVMGPVARVELVPRGAEVGLSRREGAVELRFEAAPSVTTLRVVRQ
jgi:hypothetical protein